jgi:hypothetical protein
MIRRLELLLLCAAPFFANACAVQGQPFERASVPPADAVIYVYRPYSYGGSALRPPVTCGDETARIGPGGYHAFIVPAEKTTCTIESSEATDEAEIDPAPRVHYLREVIGWGILTGHPRLDPIDGDQAQAEIQKCCVLEPADVDTPASPMPSSSPK